MLPIVLPILLDVLIVGIIVICIINGKRKGFVYTAIEMLGWIAVAFLSVSFSQGVSDWIYDSFIRDSIRSGVHSAISGLHADEIGPALNEFISGLPSFIQSALENKNITALSLAETAKSEIDITVYIADVIKPVICPLISMISGIIMFVVGLFLVHLLARICGGIVKRIPLVGTLNSILGSITGFFKGAIIDIIIVSIITNAILISTTGILGITADTLSNTYIFKALEFFIK